MRAYSDIRLSGRRVAKRELPEFFYSEPLPPTDRVARCHAAGVHRMYERLPA